MKKNTYFLIAAEKRLLFFAKSFASVSKEFNSRVEKEHQDIDGTKQGIQVEIDGKEKTLTKENFYLHPTVQECRDNNDHLKFLAIISKIVDETGIGFKDCLDALNLNKSFYLRMMADGFAKKNNGEEIDLDLLPGEKILSINKPASLVKANLKLNGSEFSVEVEAVNYNALNKNNNFKARFKDKNGNIILSNNLNFSTIDKYLGDTKNRQNNIIYYLVNSNMLVIPRLLEKANKAADPMKIVSEKISQNSNLKFSDHENHETQLLSPKGERL